MLFVLIANYLLRSGRLDKVLFFLKINIQLPIKPAVLTVVLVLLTSGSFSNYPHASKLYTSAEAYPEPKGISNMLFYLQRDPDANTVVYQLNIKNGNLNKEEPINAFWVRFSERGQIKELSGLQRKLAYGLTTKLLSSNKHELRFVSYPKLPLYLVKVPNEGYSVTANFDRKELIINRVFVRVRERSFNLPKVEYIELSGKDAQSGKDMSHRIII